jgi:hypothetical protein
MGMVLRWPFGVPNGAKFTGFATIGAAGISGQFMNVQNWSFMSGQNRFYGVVTTPDCIPVEYTEFVPPAAFNQRGNQNPFIEEEQTTQWPKEKQRSIKHTHKTKDRVTRTPLKTAVRHQDLIKSHKSIGNN